MRKYSWWQILIAALIALRLIGVAIRNISSF